ncbi:MAG TPA: ferrochelatase [Actinomycetota bacterium]|nr:ferrochelatase [Actinomycetota bacterium]
MTRQAVLVMAYGTPADLDDVERYYTDIRHGRPPTPELLERLTARYQAIGGRSPLLDVTEAQVKGLEERLRGPRAYLGLKHSAPFITDALGQIASDGVDELVGLVLAPHYSTMSIGDYERRTRSAATEIGWAGTLRMVKSWHVEPGYIEFLAEEVKRSLASLPPDVADDVLVVFSAHSLPSRILQEGDPYPHQLTETAEAVAERAGIARWRTGWQSAGRTADPWLGPDVLEIVETEAAAGTRALVVCPCGFVADHLEVLYDLDIEAAAAAAARGISLTRTRSPNDDPVFLDALAAVARRALGSF